VVHPYFDDGSEFALQVLVVSFQGSSDEVPLYFVDGEVVVFVDVDVLVQLVYLSLVEQKEVYCLTQVFDVLNQWFEQRVLIQVEVGLALEVEVFQRDGLVVPVFQFGVLFGGFSHIFVVVVFQLLDFFLCLRLAGGLCCQRVFLVILVIELLCRAVETLHLCAAWRLNLQFFLRRGFKLIHDKFF